MDKKKQTRIIAIAAAGVIALVAAIVIPISVVNCNKDDTPSGKPNGGNDKPAHEHTYGNWIYDENTHWQTCTDKNCTGTAGAKYNEAPHNKNGADNSCTVCGYKPQSNPPTPPPEKNASWDYISELVDLSKIGEGETAYCATTFKSNVYLGDGVYSETETADYYIVGAYSQSAPTKFYLFDGKNKLGYVTAYTGEGSDRTYFSGKTGGIATNGLCMWIACESRVYCITYWRLTATKPQNACDLIIRYAAEGGEIAITDTFNPNCRADFIYYRENPDGTTDSDKYQLFVGENHDEHESDSSHKITCKDKNGNEVVTNAYIVQYTPYVAEVPNVGIRTGLRETGRDEEKNLPSIPKIQRIYALGDNITGFAVTKSDLILSDGEKLFYYDWTKISASGNSNSYKSLKGADFGAYTMTGETVAIEGVSVYYIKPDFFIKNYEPVTPVKDIIVKGETFYVM